MSAPNLENLLKRLAAGEKTPEFSLRDALKRKLKKYGWAVYPELWVQKNDSSFRVDLAAHHNFYSRLGWFVFELDLGVFGKVAHCHKKIVLKYLGCQFHDFNYPELDGISPICFVAVLPSYLSDLQGFLDGGNWKDWFWLIRFFNSYGIGVLRGEHIFFDPNGASWASVYLNPEFCRYGPNQDKLKIYLEGRLNT